MIGAPSSPDASANAAASVRPETSRRPTQRRTSGLRSRSIRRASVRDGSRCRGVSSRSPSLMARPIDAAAARIVPAEQGRAGQIADWRGAGCFFRRAGVRRRSGSGCRAAIGDFGLTSAYAIRVASEHSRWLRRNHFRLREGYRLSPQRVDRRCSDIRQQGVARTRWMDRVREVCRV